ALVSSTLLRRCAFDAVFGMPVDRAGSAYVTGCAVTNEGPFPTIPPGSGFGVGGSRDAFVVKLNPAGSGVVYSTFLGGSAFDAGRAIAVDADGNAYVTGVTGSADFPTTSGA